MSESSYIIHVQPVGAGPPAIIRLRRALKCLLRTFGLRCTSVKEIPASENEPAEVAR